MPLQAVAVLLQQTATPPNDWQKTLLTALAGVCVGVLLEPIRFWIAGWLKRLQIRRLLYKDVAMNCAALAYLKDYCSCAANAGKQSSAAVVFFARQSSLDVYEHVLNTERTAFYHLPEAPAFKNFYKHVEGWILSVKPGDDNAIIADFAGEILASLEDAITTEDLDRKRLNKHKTQFARRQKERAKKYSEHIHKNRERIDAMLADLKRKDAAKAADAAS
jgi:hypothetical protein